MVDVCLPLAARAGHTMPNGLFTSTSFEDTKGFIDGPLNLNGQRTFSDQTYELDNPEGPNEGQNKRNFISLHLERKIDDVSCVNKFI